MPTNGDNILVDNQAILVVCLMANLKLNFGEIITEEIKIWVTRSDTSYPFPCLIPRLCTEAGVPHIDGIDETFYATKTHNPIRYVENQPRLTLNRGVRVEVNLSVVGPSLVPKVEVQASEADQAGLICDDDLGPSVPTTPVKAVYQLIDIIKVAK